MDLFFVTSKTCFQSLMKERSSTDCTCLFLNAVVQLEELPLFMFNLAS